MAKKPSGTSNVKIPNIEDFSSIGNAGVAETYKAVGVAGASGSMKLPKGNPLMKKKERGESF